MRLAVLTNILTPYRIPLFEALSKRLDGLHVLLMAAREENRDWQLEHASFGHEVLPGLHVKLAGAAVSRHVNFGVCAALRRARPDVVLSGGFTPANLAAWWHCRANHVPFVGWGELSSSDRRAGLPGRLLRRLLIGSGQGAVASSSEAAEVFASYGAPADAIITSVMPIDVEFYRARAQQFRAAGGLERGHATYSRPILTCVGRLESRKGYWELFAIYEGLLKEEPGATLLIVGDGPDRSLYEKHVGARAWHNVHFLGFRQKAAVAEFLALADVFVFPTLSDPFGAVLSEAMASAALVVSSVHASATHDLVDEGVTGFVIDPRDRESSIATLLRAARLPDEQRRGMLSAAYAKVAQYDIEASADRIVNFLAAVLSRSDLKGASP